MGPIHLFSGHGADLHRLRLMALSRGETKLGKDVWERTADLDERRKDRVRLLGNVPLVA